MSLPHIRLLKNKVGWWHSCHPCELPDLVTRLPLTLVTAQWLVTRNSSTISVPYYLFNKRQQDTQEVTHESDAWHWRMTETNGPMLQWRTTQCYSDKWPNVTVTNDPMLQSSLSTTPVRSQPESGYKQRVALTQLLPWSWFLDPASLSHGVEQTATPPPLVQPWRPFSHSFALTFSVPISLTTEPQCRIGPVQVREGKRVTC